jgi:hypothetical protein
MISEIEVFIIHFCMNKIRNQNPLQNSYQRKSAISVKISVLFLIFKCR